MSSLISHLFRLLIARLGLLLVSGDKRDAEILALRHQILILQRQVERPRFTPTDRTILAVLSRAFDRQRLTRVMLMWKILRDAGREPTPNRTGPSWSEFIASQAHALVATDFFCVDTVTMRRFHVLFFIEIDTRRVHLAAITTNPTGPWTTQAARNLIIGYNKAIRLVIRDGAGQLRRSLESWTASARFRGSSIDCCVGFSHVATGGRRGGPRHSPRPMSRG